MVVNEFDLVFTSKFEKEFNHNEMFEPSVLGAIDLKALQFIWKRSL